MPHALTEDHSAEDSQIRHAGTVAAWPAPAADPRVRAATEPKRAAAPADDSGCAKACKCD